MFLLHGVSRDAHYSSDAAVWGQQVSVHLETIEPTLALAGSAAALDHYSVGARRCDFGEFLVPGILLLERQFQQADAIVPAEPPAE
jgi:hypothetical protein